MILTLTIKYLVSWHCSVPSLFVRMTIFSFHGACYYQWQQQLSKLIINIWFIMSSLKYIDQYSCSKVEALFSSWLFIRPLTLERYHICTLLSQGWLCNWGLRIFLVICREDYLVWNYASNTILLIILIWNLQQWFVIKHAFILYRRLEIFFGSFWKRYF